MEKISPLVSIVITTYNRCSDLLRAINSSMIQNYENLEVIVVDNCSNDQTEIEVNRITDKRVKYYRNDKNIGAYENKRRGLALANGIYAAFLDDDDYYVSNEFIKNAVLKFNEFDISSYSASGISKSSEYGNGETIILNFLGFSNQCDFIKNYEVAIKPLSTFTTVFNVSEFRDIDAIKLGYLDDGVIHGAFQLMGNTYRSEDIVGMYAARDYKKNGNLDSEFVYKNILGMKSIWDDMLKKKLVNDSKWLEFYIELVCSFYSTVKSTKLIDVLKLFKKLRQNHISNSLIILYHCILDYISIHYIKK